MARPPHLCPCGSQRPYRRCCLPRHDGTGPAPTAEALMRSRYSAYALQLAPYLLASWHPRTRPTTLDLNDGTVWLGLQVQACQAGGPHDDQGRVTFAARFRQHGQQHTLRERSHFVRLEGAWVYLDGETDG